MTDILIISIACASANEARKLARLLVEGRLAACVQMHSIESTFHWDGAVETVGEVMLTVKTVRARLEAVEVMIRAHHSYEIPEIMAVAADWASADYARWLKQAVSAK